MDIQPVSMLSFTMQFPLMSTASQGMIIPLAGILMTSPGTSSVDMASSIAVINDEKEDTENHIMHSVSAIIMIMLLEINNVINALLNNEKYRKTV